MSERKEDQPKRHNAAQDDELSGDHGFNNASANQGGTTDMDDEALIAGRTKDVERGSGITTKRNVTGSDFDGQVA